MFAPIDIEHENGNIETLLFNPFHISMIGLNDPRDVDDGTIIYMRNGMQYYSPEPLDKIDIKIKEVADRFAAIMFTQIAGQYAVMLEDEDDEFTEDSEEP